MTVANSIIELLTTPPSDDTTIESLAEQLLSAVARCPSPHEFALDAADATDRQARRLLRPLLACLAIKSAAEAGADADIYGGRLAFTRPGPDGPVLIVGEFDNKLGKTRVSLHRSAPAGAMPEAQPPSENDIPSSAAASPRCA